MSRPPHEDHQKYSQVSGKQETGKETFYHINYRRHLLYIFLIWKLETNKEQFLDYIVACVHQTFWVKALSFFFVQYL